MRFMGPALPGVDRGRRDRDPPVLEAADFPAEVAEELQGHASKKIAADAREMVKQVVRS